MPSSGRVTTRLGLLKRRAGFESRRGCCKLDNPRRSWRIGGVFIGAYQLLGRMDGRMSHEPGCRSGHVGAMTCAEVAIARAEWEAERRAEREAENVPEAAGGAVPESDLDNP